MVSWRENPIPAEPKVAAGRSNGGLLDGDLFRETRMKMVAEYLEKALDFERLAAQEENTELKASFLAQARAYRQLADERATLTDAPIPPSAKSSEGMT